MIRKNDPNSDFWQLAEKVSRKVDSFPPWKLGRLERMDFKVGDRVIVKSRGLEECEGIVREVGGLLPDSLYVKTDSGFVYVRPYELELVPKLEQKSRFALEVTDTEFIAVSTLGPHVELSINDDETIDLHPGQARRVAMMLQIAAEELGW